MFERAIRWYSERHVIRAITRRVMRGAAMAAVAAGCATDPGPSTTGAVCHEVGTLSCAVTIKQSECANTPGDELACIDDYVAQCCSDAASSPRRCDAPIAGPAYPSFKRYDACHAALRAMTCMELEGDVALPGECVGVFE